MENNITIQDIINARDLWIAAVRKRDIEATITLYDRERGTLLGTVDKPENGIRTGAERIRDYFNHFLGGNDEVEPTFPKDAEANMQTFDNVATYSGYYTFRLVRGKRARIANAKFTFVYQKQPDGQVKILVHNSGLTPQGIVNE